MKLVISIPVHESPLCVLDQVRNIHKYVPSCAAVVVHVSGSSENALYETLVDASRKEFNGFLFINSTQYKTHMPGEAGNVTGLSTIYCDNFRFMSKIMSFDFYSPSTSNEMFVRSGLENLIEKYSCQYFIYNPPTKVDRVLHVNFSEWENILYNKYNCKYPEFGVCVGSFFHFDVWKSVSDIVLDKLSQERLFPIGSSWSFCRLQPDRAPIPIGMDEYLLPTLIFNLYPELYNSIIPESYVLCPKDYNPNAPFVPEPLILAVKNGEYPYKFVVKRVPRDINHPIRTFINRF